MGKNTQSTQRAFMHKNIPYRYCYEEGGMIETEPGIFTRTYEIMSPGEEVKGGYHAKMTRELTENILQKLSEKFSFQFTIRNCHMDKEEYLSGLMMSEDVDDDGYGEFRKHYNRMLRDNCDIGHNNYLRTVYLTISVAADTPDEAYEKFTKSDGWLAESFASLYGFRIRAMDLPERLQLLYDIYHPDPGSPKFGSRVDYDGKGFSVKSMQRMRMDTKDTISPDKYECRERDYMKVGNHYVRMFFINSLPESLPDSVLLDLASVSSNSILSVHYERVDEELSFRVAANYVKDNTEVLNIPIRDTVTDRKERRMQRQERNIRDNEDEYFYQAALDMFKKAKAKEQTTIQASFIIALFAESLEELNRDSKLLRLSASKYVCQIRCLELQQNEGFQSVLPLNNLKVNVQRMFSIEQMAGMQPLSIQSIFEKVRTFYGLNAINDNFVIIDRTNYPTAMIAGGENLGQTTSVKREAMNTLLSTRDDVVILTGRVGEYEQFADRLQGRILRDFSPDVFDKDSNYNLKNDKAALQKIFMEAYLTAKIGFHHQRLQPEVLQGYYEQAEREAEILSRCADRNEALMYAKEHPVELQLFVKSLEQFRFRSDRIGGEQRLKVIGYETEDELLVNLDYLWNYAVQSKKKNRTVWIYVDAADPLVYSVTGSDYLICLLERAEILRVPVTLVIQDAVHIVTNQKAVIEMDYLLNKVRYFKLLSMGPVERKKFVERLNISQQLIPYFVDRGPGEGILITPSANVAFNDRFEDRENEFYKLFR